MKNLNSRNTKGFVIKNSVQYKTGKSQAASLNNKNERRNKMKHYLLRSKSKLASAVISLSMLISSFSINGCGDSNISGVQDKEATIKSAGENLSLDKTLSGIKLDMNLKFGSKSIKESRMLQSNNGEQFNHIVSIDSEIKPDEEIDLQELQPYGIFGLYICATDEFTLSNSDGMSFTSKTLLMEKCSFIDLKLKNVSQKSIQVKGFVAGE